MKFDFGGYATKNDLKCSDGRIIRHGAFEECDGKVVPLVWQHQHDSVDNVLGHAMLENREDGVYAYCSCNDTPVGKQAKSLVQHGDISSLSIYANRLRQNGDDVIHGVIREVSLVLSGANPGALIDNLQFAHSDGMVETIDDEAIMYFDDALSTDISHEDSDESDDSDDSDETVEDVFNTLTDKQKTAVYAVIGAAMEADEDESESSSEEVSHADSDEEETSEEDDDDDETIGDIMKTLNDEQQSAVNALIEAIAGDTEVPDGVEDAFNTLSEKQKNAVYVIVGSMDEDDEEDGGEEMEHSDTEGENIVKHNAFDAKNGDDRTVLSHDDMKAILEDARTSGNGSLKDAALAHGITDIEVLFPEAQAVNNTPAMITRRMDWVSGVLGAVRKSPFSRVKSIAANITADEARARGYIKGNRKVEEQISALKRVTTPQTVYKLQKLDRDDIIDITDFDVVAWMKQEMRMMLDEELARAILVGDGRPSTSDDKILEDHIRPVWTDVETYTTHTVIDDSLTGSARAKAFIEAAIRSRKFYKGSGTPTLYVGQDLLTEMRLIRDADGYRLYKNDQELADELRVAKIVEIELFDGVTRTVGEKTHKLGGIIVNLADYNMGATRGGEVTLFDDFDLNYNKYEYLIETRCSGALIQPMAALAIEFAASATNDRYTLVTPEEGDSPLDKGWYELTGNGYVESEDTEVVSGKAYYEKVSA